MGQSIARRMTARLQRLVFGLAVLMLGVGATHAQDRRQNETGQFDFYVLALSWSPSFCEGRGRALEEPLGAAAMRRQALLLRRPRPAGPSTSRAFRNIASVRRRGSIVASFPRCSI